MLAFFVAAVAALLCSLASAAGPDYHTLPSGRRIPLAVIRTHPYADRTGEHAHQLYELSAAGKLSSAMGEHAALHTTTTKRPLSYAKRFTMSLNGRMLDDKLPAATVHTGDGFSAVFAHGDDKPAAISLGDVDLVPLHFADHPGVYIAPAGRVVGEAVESKDTVVAPPAGLLGRSVRAGDSELHQDPPEEEGDDASMEGGEHVANGSKDTSSSRMLDAHHVSRTNLATTMRARRWCGKNAAKRFLELAIAFDNTLCARFGNDYTRAVAAIQKTTIDGNAAFWQDTCVRMAVVHIEAHCENDDDPYASTKNKPLADVATNFQNGWKEFRGWLERDFALLITGYQSPQNSDTIAVRDGACSKTNGYGVTERVTRRGIATAAAYAMGGRNTDSGLLGVASATSPIRLAPQSVTQVRNFLETDGRSWCILPQRRFCPAKCSGQCIKGTCVTGSVSTPPKQCAATFPRWRPLACELGLESAEIVTPWLDELKVTAALGHGNVVVQVEVVTGGVDVQVGFAVGKDVTEFGIPPGTTNDGKKVTFGTPVGQLVAPDGGCCGKRINITLRVAGRLGDVSGVERYNLWFTLSCKQVCFGRGQPLPMTKDRLCPKCSV